jgi:radical SAM superfamily enzyme YgiQ (UPF0313 family)
LRVLFVHTPISGAAFNTSIAALSAWLKRHGHETRLLIVPPEPELERVRALMAETAADVVAFSFMTCREALVKTLAPLARAALPEARIVAGGAHPTSYPTQTLGEIAVDAVCVGEGEEPLRRWLEDPRAPAPGILRRGSDALPEKWWAKDVDDLPDWDRALFGDVRNHGNRFESAVGVAFARGFCPYSCTFCGVDGYRRLNGVTNAKASRLRSVERVLAEIEQARKLVPCDDGFASWDEVLPPQLEWLREFFEKYRARVGLPFACQLRIEQVRPELVDAMVRGGCDYVVIGVETGDEEYRRKILNKPFTNERAKNAFRMLHAAGIRTYCSFMIGLPFETPKMLAQSVRLAEELDPGELSWKYYTPERGTVLFGLVEREGLVIDRYVDQPFGAGEAMIKMTRCTQADLDKASRAFRLLSFGRARGTFAEDPGHPLALELRS